MIEGYSMLRSFKSKILFAIVALTTVALVGVTFMTRENFAFEVEDLHKKLLRNVLRTVTDIVASKYDDLLKYELDSIARQRFLMESTGRVVLTALASDYSLYKSRAVSEDDAKRKSLDWIQNLIYGDNQYFFVCDINLIGLSHPVAAMIGKKWEGFKDLKQQDALLLMRDVLMTQKSGYTVFEWPALREQNVVKQMAYFVYFPEWEWIVGTSVRIDDIEKDSNEKINIIITELKGTIPGIRISEAEEIYLFDGNGNMIVHSGISDSDVLHAKNNAADQDDIIQCLMQAAKNPNMPLTHQCFLKDEHGPRSLSYVAYYQPTDWYLTVSVHDDAISRPVANLVMRQIYIIIGILLIGIAVAILLTNRIAGRLHLLACHAMDLAQRDLAADDAQPLSDLIIAGSDDEVGGLINAFVFMEDQLSQTFRALTRESAVNKAFAEMSGALIQSIPVDDVASLILGHARQLTNSEYGWVGHIDPATGNLIVPTFTRGAWDICQVRNKRIVFERFAGLWGWVLTNRRPLLTNSPTDDSRSSGVPDGHIKIDRFISAPALMGDTVVGQISLANPGRDFTQEDSVLVERFASLYALALQRKHTEDALRESEERYRNLVEYSNDWLWEVDRNGVYTYASPHCRELLGYEPKELIGKTPFDLMPPDEAKRVEKWFASIAAQRKPFRALENTIRHKDGHLVDLETNGVPMLDGEGNLLGYRGTDRDITERKRTERELRASETRYRVVADNTYDWEYWIDSEGRFLYMSPSCQRITGYSAGDFEKDPKLLFNILHPDDRAQFEAHREQARTTGALCELEFRIISRDNETRWIGHACQPVFDAQGLHLGRRASNRDITDQRKLAESHRKEIDLQNLLLWLYQKASKLPDKELYDYVLEHAVQLTESTVGFFHLVSDDQKNVILTTWNREALKNCTAPYATHYPVEQAGNWVDCLRFKRPILYNDYPNSPNRKGLPEGHSSVRRFMSVPVVEEDNVRIIFGVGNKPDEYDEHDVMQIQLLANNFQNIIGRLRAERALRESEERFRQLAENITKVFWIADLELTEMLYVSPAYEQIWGHTCASVYANPKSWLESVHPEDFGLVTDTLAKRGSRAHSMQYRIVRPDGSIRWILDRSFPVRNKDEEVYRFAGISEDITERKQMEVEQERLLEQAQSDTRLKARLLREVNHRVKNNLMAILGLLLAEQQAALAEGRDIVERVVGDLSQRVKALLQVHRMLADSEWAPMRLSDLASQIIGTVIAGVPSDRPVVTKILPAPIEVSPRQASNLALVFTELATNTIKHGLLEREATCITVEVAMEDDLIFLEYRDNGPGYPPEVLCGKGGSVGMQLIRQLIVETLRGTVSLANENGAVTTLCIKTEATSRT